MPLALGETPSGAVKTIALDEEGRTKVSGELTGAGGAGLATSDLQQDQLDALADVLAEVTGAAKDVSVVQVETAVAALGNGATLAHLLTELGLHGDALDTVVARLDVALSTRSSEATQQLVESAVDELEPDLDAIRVALEAFDSKAHPAWRNVIPAATSGGGLTILSGAGRVRFVRTTYTETLTSGLYITYHDAASVGACSSSTLIQQGDEIDMNEPLADLDAPEAIAVANGFTVAFSSTRDTFTLASSADGYVAGRVYP